MRVIASHFDTFRCKPILLPIFTCDDMDIIRKCFTGTANCYVVQEAQNQWANERFPHGLDSAGEKQRLFVRQSRICYMKQMRKQRICRITIAISWPMLRGLIWWSRTWPSRDWFDGICRNASWMYICLTATWNINTQLSRWEWRDHSVSAKNTRALRDQATESISDSNWLDSSTLLYSSESAILLLL